MPDDVPSPILTPAEARAILAHPGYIWPEWFIDYCVKIADEDEEDA